MKSLILFGSGGHSKACIEVIESSQEFKIKGIVIHPKEEIKEFMNYKIIGNDNNFNNGFTIEDNNRFSYGSTSFFNNNK